MSFKLESWPSQTYSFTLPMRYHLAVPKGQTANGKSLVVCLHGYQDHALSMLKRIGWWETEKPFSILAINAPFPVPIWTKTGFKEAYAWYFRDTERGFTIVSPQQMAERISELLAELQLQSLPTVLFGFSQGAYLAPFIAKHIQDLRAFVSLGSGYPSEPYAPLKRTSIYAIHGEQDQTIPLKASQLAHADLLKMGFQGKFFTIPNLDHRVDPEVEPLIERLCMESFK